MNEKLLEAPPPPSLEPLRVAGERTVAEDEFSERLEELERRRSLLRTLLAREDRDWQEVFAG